MSIRHSCRVMGCKNKHTHVTYGHRCLSCNNDGHGQIECGNLTRINALYKESFNDKLKFSYDWCTIRNCKYPWSHMNKAHYCSICNGLNHSSGDCPSPHGSIYNRCREEQLYNVKCPICLKDNIVNIVKDKAFGLDTLCKSCFVNTINIRLPNCKHTLLCGECCIEIDKNKL